MLGISARSHVDAATLRRALERMDAAWPEGEEHMAKLSVNAMIGLWARSAEVVYSVRSSSGRQLCSARDSDAFSTRCLVVILVVIVVILVVILVVIPGNHITHRYS